MHSTLRFAVALGFPTLAFLSPVLGNQAGLSMVSQGVLFACFIMLGAVLTSELSKPSKLAKNRITCQASTKNGEQCKHLAAAGEKCCHQHQSSFRPRLRAFVRKHLNHAATAVSVSLTIWFGVQPTPLVVSFSLPSPRFASERSASPTRTVALKPLSVPTLKVGKSTVPSGTVAPDFVASEAPLLPTESAVSLGKDLLTWVSGQSTLPTLASGQPALAPQAPTGLIASVQ
jgi:hypothetical protein